MLLNRKILRRLATPEIIRYDRANISITPGRDMDFCAASRSLSSEVQGFIKNVHEVKEESITDFFAWKWREFDPRFKFINVRLFTREEESSTTGADFQLQIWFVDSQIALPLLFQAKILKEPYNAYRSALAYPKDTCAQLDRLLTHAKATRQLPFYAFYAVADQNTSVLCARGSNAGGIFMADALSIEKIARSKAGSHVSKNDLLKLCNPFSCLFCCPLVTRGAARPSLLLGIGQYIRRYFPHLVQHPMLKNSVRAAKDVPPYVQALLHGEQPDIPTADFERDNDGLHAYRVIGVYDFRDDGLGGA